MYCRVTIRIVLGVMFCFCVDPLYTQELLPLHAKIDQSVADAVSEFERRAGPLTTDSAFLRRIYLDLTGTIPTVTEARAFLDNNNEDKRAAIIDRLLMSPRFSRHMQHEFDVMLMQRRPAKYVTLSLWQTFLFEAFRNNLGWDEMTRQILSADGANPENRPPARFLLDRDLNPQDTTRDIGRVFLGRDLQCAQCHDHPHFEDYLQRHYFGISAFFSRSYIFKDPNSKEASLGEKADGVVKFTSVFTSQESEISPRLLDLPEIIDPPLEEEPYITKPDDQTRGIPKYSRRQQLAETIVKQENSAFQLNITNRIWAMLMGRGLVEPVDMFHQDNPPTHPKLLELLSNDLRQHQFDMRYLIRELVLSHTYQRSSRLMSDVEPPAEELVAGQIRPLTPEQLGFSMLEAVGHIENIRLATTTKLLEEQPQRDTTSVAFTFEVEQAINGEVQPHIDAFVNTFASNNESRQFDATANQALFLMNSPLLDVWLQPSKNNLVARLQSIHDIAALSDELYMSIFSRHPNEFEASAVQHFLNSFADKRVQGLQELTRTLLCSAEFRLNH